MKNILKTSILLLTIVFMVSCKEKSNSNQKSIASNAEKSKTPSDIASANVLEFTPNGILFVGDSYTGTIVAYETESVENTAKGTAYNLKDFDSKIEKLLGVQSDEMLIKDLAVHPESNEAYIAVSYISGETYAPAIIIANQSGDVRLMDLNLKNTKLPLNNTFKDDYKFYNNFEAKRLSITDIDFHNNKLYISGLSNQDFSSTLRIAEYPFNGKSTTSSVEIFHAMHDQNETRAPIRSLSVVNLEGKDHILAAYTCTPLVTIPLDALVDGAHVKGKTIGDIGYGNTPIDMLKFMGEDMQKNKFEIVLLTNKNRAANILPVGGIAEANKGKGLTTFQGFGSFGFQGYKAPLAGLSHVAEQDGYHILSIRRDMDSGDLQLVSFLKNLYMRISDFQTEYELPGYTYSEEQGWIKELQDTMKKDENFEVSVEK
jgi:hypothetical protein